MSLSNPLLALEQKILGDIYTSTETMDNLVVLCDQFGSRFGGTEGEAQAARFLKAKLESYGLKNVHLEPIPYMGWERGPDPVLEILSPIQRRIPCITLPHSPATVLEAVLVDMEDGAPEDFVARSAEIPGKIVLTTSVTAPKGSKRWVHRIEKYGRSVIAGAVGFIFVNHYPGYGPATGGIGPDIEGGGEALIPGISLAKEDGAFLQRLIRQAGEVRLRLTTHDQCRPMTSWNVIGDLPGQHYPDQIIMLGSHYDGHDISQGAEDPASGTVAVLEAARVLATHAGPLPCTVRFALWGVEEIGLIGSTHYAKQHAAELGHIRFYFNMDSAGAMHQQAVELNKWPELEPLFRQWQKEMALDFLIRQSIHAHSDHYPFLLAGVPTGSIEPETEQLQGRGYGHTMYDTLDKVSLKPLREASALAARLALRMALVDVWPAQQRTQTAVQSLLDGPHNREEVAIFAQLEAYYRAHKQ